MVSQDNNGKDIHSIRGGQTYLYDLVNTTPETCCNACFSNPDCQAWGNWPDTSSTIAECVLVASTEGTCVNRLANRFTENVLLTADAPSMTVGNGYCG